MFGMIVTVCALALCALVPVFFITLLLDEFFENEAVTIFTAITLFLSVVGFAGYKIHSFIQDRNEVVAQFEDTDCVVESSNYHDIVLLFGPSDDLSPSIRLQYDTINSRTGQNTLVVRDSKVEDSEFERIETWIDERCNATNR